MKYTCTRVPALFFLSHSLTHANLVKHQMMIFLILSILLHLLLWSHNTMVTFNNNFSNVRVMVLGAYLLTTSVQPLTTVHDILPQMSQSVIRLNRLEDKTHLHERIHSKYVWENKNKINNQSKTERLFPSFEDRFCRLGQSLCFGLCLPHPGM